MYILRSDIYQCVVTKVIGLGRISKNLNSTVQGLLLGPKVDYGFDLTVEMIRIS